MISRGCRAAAVGRVGVLGLAVALVLLLVGAVGAQAATFTVNTTADDSSAPSASMTSCPATCTLRDAMIAAGNTAGASTIDLPAGHYTLSLAPSGTDDGTTGDLHFTGGTLQIVGASASSTIIDATGLGDRVLDLPNGGSLTLAHLTITGGSVSDGSNGGGIRDEGAANLTLNDVAVVGNVVSQSGDGGGISIASPGTATIDDSLIANNKNSGDGGGILMDDGTLSITNSTIADNTVDTSLNPSNPGWGAFGGAMEVDFGTVGLTNVTIAGNTIHGTNGRGSGTAISGSGSGITGVNVIVYGNAASGTPGTTNCDAGPLTSSGHNIDQDGTCFSGGPGDTSANPNLGSLANNGGETDTMALLDGSSAINAGDNTNCPSPDQRGVTRPQGSACDIGAYEATPPIVQTLAASGVTQTSATLNGTVNPDNLKTTYHFEYGLTTGYGSSTPTQSVGSDYAVHSESATISGLAPGTTYHYRIVATNAIGTSDGADMTFKTASPPPVIPAAAPKPLKLSVSPHSTVAGNRVCYSFKATSSGHGVSGVTIRFTGHTAHTSSTGKARICETLRRHATYTAHASKSGYSSATARVTVKPKPKAKPKPLVTG